MSLMLKVFQSFTLVILLFFGTGCQGLFFYPQKELLLSPDALGVSFETKEIQTSDGEKLFAWVLQPAISPKGTIAFFHGNAENISTHIGSVYWLPKYGFRILIVDYRGYGRSSGTPSIAGLIEDVQSSLSYVLDRNSEYGEVCVFSQSLGASIAVTAVAQFDRRSQVRAMVIDSAFSDYQKIVQDKLSAIWLTWPFQKPLSLMFSNEFSPLKHVSQLKGMPLLFAHGERDQIVLPYHTRRLYEASEEPKDAVFLKDAHHTQVFRTEEMQKKLVSFFELHGCK